MADSIFKQIGGVVSNAINDAKTELQGNIDALTTSSTTTNTTLTNNLNAEISRASAAEESNATAISDETTARTALENTVNGMFTSSNGITLANQDIIPANAAVSLGSIDKPFADVFISQSSLYVNGTKVLSENAGTIDISADPDQNIRISTQGAGDIEFYPSGAGVIQMKGTLSLQAGDNLVSSDGQPINCPVGFTTLTVQNLTVTGTTTTVNTATLNVADNIITLNADVVGTPTENAGIEVERGDENNAKIIFNETVDAWQVTNDGVNYKNIGSGAWGEITGTLSAQTDLQTALDGKLATTANAVSATKLQTSRSIALSGDVTGSVNFDGTANVTITTVIADDSHNHTIANVDGLQTALDGKSATTHTHDDRYYTEAEVGTITEFDTALAAAMA